jgi:hypothetical protein
MKNIAVVIGGGARVWGDIDRAVAFCNENNIEPVWFATNDMVEKFCGPIIAVTLHPDKLAMWLERRQSASFPMPHRVWSHKGGAIHHPHVTDQIKDLGGSVGMFGYTVARHLGFDRVVLCGVPMTRDPHFVRNSPWIAVRAFTRAWDARKTEMMPYVRSLSGGWTEQLFGVPDTEWLA